MKIKTAKLLVTVALVSFFTPSLAQAGGNTGQRFAKLNSPKHMDQAQQSQSGRAVANVCPACNQLMLVRVVKGGKGQYDRVAIKCEDCGLKATSLAISNKKVPFKERIKR
jgi:predicted RNA-binding Zn-ribbon protein involved in translation (DUF1610 family)